MENWFEKEVFKIKDILLEIEYIRNHFPEIVMSALPTVLVVLTVLQFILIFIKRGFKDGKTAEGISGVMAVIWVLLVISAGVYAYFNYFAN